MGLLIAEIALLRYPERLAASVTLPKHSIAAREQSMASKCLWTLVFVIGLFLLGQPDDGVNALGIFGDWPWALLRSWLPSDLCYGDRVSWYLGIGSFFLILGLEMYPTLRVPLRCGWSQYVGELSFGIYALHIPIWVAIIHHWYEVDVRQAYGWDNGWGVLPGALILHVAVFTCADYFNRLDRRVVRLGRWIQEQCFERWEKM
jgi:peptidoglycan/LPS O-acetylase OafA/YrhL